MRRLPRREAARASSPAGCAACRCSTAAPSSRAAPAGRASPSRSPKGTSSTSATPATAWSAPRSSAPAAARTRATSFPTARRRPASAIASIRSASRFTPGGRAVAGQARPRRAGGRTGIERLTLAAAAAPVGVVDPDPNPGSDQRPPALARRPHPELPCRLPYRAREVRAARTIGRARCNPRRDCQESSCRRLARSPRATLRGI